MIRYLTLVLLLGGAWLRCSQSQLRCEKSTPCSCEGSNFSKIDVEEILKFSIGVPIKDKGEFYGKYDYLVNFCHGLTCPNDPYGGQNAIACQRQIDGFQNISSKLGDVMQYSWQVFRNDTFAVLFKGGDATRDGPRYTLLYITVGSKNDSKLLNYVTFIEERTRQPDNYSDNHADVYVFSLVIDSPSPTSSTSPPSSTSPKPSNGTKLSLLSLFLIVFVSCLGLVIFCCIAIIGICVCWVIQDRKKNISEHRVVDDVRQPLIQ